MVVRTSGSFFSNRYLLYLLESNVGKKDPRCHNMPITIGSIFEKGQGALHEKDWLTVFSAMNTGQVRLGLK